MSPVVNTVDRVRRVCVHVTVLSCCEPNVETVLLSNHQAVQLER